MDNSGPVIVSWSLYFIPVVYSGNGTQRLYLRFYRLPVPIYPRKKGDLFQPAIRVPSRLLSPGSLTIYYSEKMETASHILSIVLLLGGGTPVETWYAFFQILIRSFFLAYCYRYSLFTTHHFSRKTCLCQYPHDVLFLLMQARPHSHYKLSRDRYNRLLFASGILCDPVKRIQHRRILL